MTGFADLRERARALATGERRALLGITGSPGAGKTTLAVALVRALGAELGDGIVAHVPMDGYHLADVELERLGRRGRKGAPDTFDPGGYAALLRRLRSSPEETVYAPAFDRDIEQPIAGSIPVHPRCRLVVTEGNYLLLDEPAWRAARAELDAVWFVEADEALRRERLVARHVEFGKASDTATAWVAGTDEPNARLVEATRERADLVVRGFALPELPG
ncbi:nucleoside/nucleotide kinase family protein [Pseudonocardia sp.]|uniref:nucleoside/nucleotide kinase family protein n=1 Tax=Pseudonocardia sp. TaxID=60912 RepID=UPI003D12A04C